MIFRMTIDAQTEDKLLDRLADTFEFSEKEYWSKLCTVFDDALSEYLSNVISDVLHDAATGGEEYGYLVMEVKKRLNKLEGKPPLSEILYAV